MNPTDEQLDILSAATATSSNLMISALAGTGKTSTLESIERAVDRQPILYLVFNKKNADEAALRMLPTTTVRTFNSLGHRIWSETQSRRLNIDARKTYTIFRSIVDAAPRDTRDALWSVYSPASEGVALAKALGYIPEGNYPSAKRLITRTQLHSALDEAPDELTADLIDAILNRSIKQSYDGILDYNDQVYMPALFGGVYPKFPLVLVDEYQDLSPVNHALLERLIKGRLIGVGDPYQNIYGFRGAKAGGMDQAATHYECLNLPLSTSFRCPSEIVRHVHWRVPNFRWANTGGRVDCPSTMPASDFASDATVLCRNNAPLLTLGLRLLTAGHSVSMAGTDIGPKLIKLMSKLGPESLSRKGVLASIADWEAERLERESKNAEDLAACMRVFANATDNLRSAIAYAEHLFKQTGQIHLSTIHKAKGLEWSTVYHLDPWLVRKHPTEQSKNLDYVASTRSCDRLIEIDSEGIQW